MNQPPTIPIGIMLQQYLRSLEQAGVTHIPLGDQWVLPEGVESRPKHKPQQQPSTPQPQTVQQQNSSEVTTVPSQHVALNVSPCTLSLEDRIAKLNDLSLTVANCTRCQQLVETRTQTVFGAGNPQAKIMFLGEAPGADEDEQGEPFVGKDGQLLNNIIGAMKLTRDEIYICNILRCRPPSNRNPSDEEATNCREYLDGQIAIVDPDYIVCWGSVAAKNLLSTKMPIGKMRQQFFEYGRAKVACTYHPAYLLRNPSAKKDVWADMKWLLQDMGVTL